LLRHVSIGNKRTWSKQLHGLGHATGTRETTATAAAAAAAAAADWSKLVTVAAAAVAAMPAAAACVLPFFIKDCVTR
jgi:hypothetical protein